MIASASADSDRCLGKHGSGKVGVILIDDESSLPFQVECEGSTNWYTPEELEPEVKIDTALSADGASGLDKRDMLWLWRCQPELWFRFLLNPLIAAEFFGWFKSQLKTESGRENVPSPTALLCGTGLSTGATTGLHLVVAESRYNDEYYCQVHRVCRCSDTVVVLAFTTVGDGSLGPLQNAKDSRLLVGGRRAALLHCSLHVETPNKVQGELVFAARDGDLTFSFGGNRGYSAVTLTASQTVGKLTTDLTVKDFFSTLILVRNMGVPCF